MNKDLFLKWKELKSMQVLANSQHKPLVCFLGSTFQFQNEPFASSWIEKFVPQGNVYWSDPKKLSDKAVMLYGDLYDLAKERVELGLPSPEMPAGFFENHKDLMSLRDFLN